ncbi:MAG: hypothetical protein AAGF97_18435, partial [Planctomycetota bacterium]
MSKTIARAGIAWTTLTLMAATLQADSAGFRYDPDTGIMTVDSGSHDLVAIFIEGPDVTATCNLCDGENLPGEDELVNISTWTQGFINGSTQWIRTNPLSGRGFIGL